MRYYQSRHEAAHHNPLARVGLYISAFTVVLAIVTGVLVATIVSADLKGYPGRAGTTSFTGWSMVVVGGLTAAVIFPLMFRRHAHSALVSGVVVGRTLWDHVLAVAIPFGCLLLAIAAWTATIAVSGGSPTPSTEAVGFWMSLSVGVLTTLYVLVAAFRLFTHFSMFGVFV
jgi:hypothetical protein